jgi:Protein of unknown function (DUF3822)
LWPFIEAGKPTIFKFLSIIACNQNDLLKQLFHIQNGNPENVQQVLSLRLGEKHGSFSITNKQENELYELTYCSVEEWNENSLTDFFASYPSLQNSFYQVLVTYDFPESILTPSVFYKPEESQTLLNTMHGVLPGTQIISEQIAEWQLYNTYAVSAEVKGWVNKKFPAAQFRHQYSLGIKRINAAGNSGCLLVDFRRDDFTLLVANNSQLLLAQSFPYTTPEDVVYYLLKTCQQFSLSQKEVNLQLSGLIDKQSSLYNELYQYFINVEFREADWNAESKYPAHFFTSLNDLAKCAS